MIQIDACKNGDKEALGELYTTYANRLLGVCWKSHTNLTHPGKYFRPSKVKIMRPTSPK